MFEFNKADKCSYCYFLVEEEDKLKSEKNCCFKFAMKGEKVVICSSDKFFCVFPMKRLIKSAFLGCMLNYESDNFSELVMPIPCGSASDYI